MGFSQKLRCFLILKLQPNKLLQTFKSTCFLIISMAHTTPCHLTSPFQEIHNRSLPHPELGTDRIYKDNVVKSTQKGSCQWNQPSQIQETLRKNEFDRTIKKEKPVYNQELGSVKTINDQGYPTAKEELYQTQWNLFKGDSDGQISRTLRILTSFVQVKQHFIEFAKQSKLVMCQNTESFVTVKKGGSGSCRCIFQMWTRSEPQATVYQLRKLGRDGQRAKIILVEGNRQLFYSFFLSFLKQLESKQLVKVLAGQKVQIIFEQQKKEVYECEKVIASLRKRIAKGKRADHEEIDSIVSRLRNQASRLKQIVRTTAGLTDVPSMERSIELLSYQASGVVDLFGEAYYRQFEDYKQKRQRLLKRHALSELFKQLDISEHFNRFRRLRSSKDIETQEKVPYMAAIKDLKRLASAEAPGPALELALVFHQRIRSCYSHYFKNCRRLGDMDDYLPVTIFCVLAVECDRNLLGTVKWLLSELSSEYDSQWQKKTLTDLEAAFDYISNQWQAA